MRIGIDARFLTHPQVGGFKSYTTNLVQALGQVDSTDEYFLYLDRQVPLNDLPKYENFHYKIIASNIPGLGQPFREQIGLRQQMAWDRLDIVHFLCNTAPVHYSRNFVLTLHDTFQLNAVNTFPLWKSLLSHKKWAMTAYSRWAIVKSVYRATRIITVSHYERGLITNELSLSPDKVAVTHLAPNPVYMKADAETRREWRDEFQKRFQMKGNVILGIGYELRKNIDLLIRSFSLVAADDENSHLILVCAEKHQREIFCQLVCQLGLEKRVSVLGEQSLCELNMLYNIADLFVFPSKREGFGLPPLEASACGTPTIAMNTTSIPEIMQDSALLIHSEEPQIWANAIKQLLADESAREEMAQRGLRRASQFSWLRCAQETIDVYQEAVR